LTGGELAPGNYWISQVGGFIAGGAIGALILGGLAFAVNFWSHSRSPKDSEQV